MISQFLNRKMKKRRPTRWGWGLPVSNANIEPSPLCSSGLFALWGRCRVAEVATPQTHGGAGIKVVIFLKQGWLILPSFKAALHGLFTMICWSRKRCVNAFRHQRRALPLYKLLQSRKGDQQSNWALNSGEDFAQICWGRFARIPTCTTTAVLDC